MVAEPAAQPERAAAQGTAAVHPRGSWWSTCPVTLASPTRAGWVTRPEARRDDTGAMTGQAHPRGDTSRTARRIDGAPEAGERIVVGVSGAPGSERLIRRAARIARSTPRNSSASTCSLGTPRTVRPQPRWPPCVTWRTLSPARSIPSWAQMCRRRCWSSPGLSRHSAGCRVRPPPGRSALPWEHGMGCALSGRRDRPARGHRRQECRTAAPADPT
jgi:hypothetical protein